MVILMLDDPGRETAIRFRMFVPVLVEISDGQVLMAVHVLPDIGNAQASFIKAPLVAALFRR